MKSAAKTKDCVLLYAFSVRSVFKLLCQILQMWNTVLRLRAYKKNDLRVHRGCKWASLEIGALRLGATRDSRSDTQYTHKRFSITKKKKYKILGPPAEL
jgi:hypothetical protein